MTTRVLLTVDTEIAWRHQAAGLSWQEALARSYDPAGVGVPFQLRMLAEHGLSACFFVDPMPALIHGLEPIRQMVGPILNAGQEVQLHLHPFWAALARDGAAAEHRELAELTADEQQDLIEQARDLLIAAGAPPPTAFRAGSYAANADTLRTLPALGIRYDSSHTGSHHPHPSALPLAPGQVAPVELGGIVEVPVSQIEASPGRLRHLPVCALSLDEMIGAIDHARRWRHPLVTIVSHSFELATRDGLRVNEIARRRFVSLCEWLCAHSERVPTASFADLTDLPLGAPARPMQGRPLQVARRVVEQAWGDLRYEKPGRSLTAAAASSVGGIEVFAAYVL